MLKQGTDLLELVVNSLPDHCIIVVSADGTVRRWSNGAERITGLSADQAIGQKYGVVQMPEGAAPRGIAIRQAREAGRYQHEGWWVRPDGERFWMEEVIAPMLDDGELIGFVDIARDHTQAHVAAENCENLQACETDVRAHLEFAERRAAFLDEASSILAASSISFESAVRNLARLTLSRLADWCVIYSLEPDGKLKTMAVAHRDPNRQRLLDQMVTGNQQPARPNPIRSVIETGEPELFETVSAEQLPLLAMDAAQADTLRELGVTSAMITPLPARGRILGAVMLASSRPETTYNTDDLHLAEELGRRAAIAIDNARLYREAQQASRAKSDFLAIVSHELRTPLNAIMGYSDIIEAGISGPVTENQKRQISRIRTSARHLLQIIEEILSYARLESGGLEIERAHTTVGTIANEVCAITEPVALGKGLTLEVKLPVPDRKLITDAPKARQILVNLISNAIKFTERGTVELTASVQGDQALFAVRDTGVGMTSEMLERIFDPFWQVERPTTRRTGGTGLGLSVARRFAQLLGGEITVQSEPRVGSTFVLQLPLIAPETPPAKAD
jgi:PAS domain S-box-containing protein